MNLYLIVSDKDTVYDSYDSHIAVAENKEQVVELAQLKATDEDRDAWIVDNVSILGVYEGEININHPLLLLSSFNAG